MELTCYYDSIDLEDQVLLFNTFYGYIIKISKYKYNFLVNNLFYKFKNTELELLKNMKFIVKSKIDEQEELKKHLYKLKYKSNSLTITILTTMECNLACLYCHEKGMICKKYLKRDKIDDINNWIEKEVDKNGYKSVLIYFYGGEPTLNINAIERISSNFLKLKEKKHINCEFTLTTNGTLLNDDIVNKLLTFGIKDIQITIDGPKEVHDYRKPFLDNTGTFDIIVGNIEKYCELLNFTIRSNVDKHNFDRIPELIDFISEKSFKNKINFYIDFVSSIHNTNSFCNNNIITDLTEMSKVVELWKYQVKRGIPLIGKNVIEGLCGNLSKSNVTISVDGKLSICPGLCSIKELEIGDVLSGFNHKYSMMVDVDIWEDCLSCKYAPMCVGGCRAQAYIKNKNCLSCYCKKEYYELVVMEYIRCKYDL